MGDEVQNADGVPKGTGKGGRLPLRQGILLIFSFEKILVSINLQSLF